MPTEEHPSGLSSQQISELRESAKSAAERSYSPYSRFRVGAAVLLEDGRIFTGANIENASYRLTICAEHTAIAKAVDEAGSTLRIRAIAVENLNGAASFPCGPCRQILFEFGNPDTWIFAPGETGAADSSLGDLLPFAFHL
jgi:cytidine deaminase